MLAIWMILPATRSNVKQNIQFQKQNWLAIMPKQVELTAIPFDV